MRKARVAVLVSGRGSNLGALLEAARAADYPAAITLVISNRPGAGALDIAGAAGVETATIEHAAYPDRAAFEAAIDAVLRAADIEIVCLAGFMRILTAPMVAAWAGRIINIHPSLLPAFRGLNTHRRALEAGVAIHGCTVHAVGVELDEGPALMQAAVPVMPGDDEDTLAARVLAAEHRIYPMALALLAGRITGARVALPQPDPSAALIVPGLPR